MRLSVALTSCWAISMGSIALAGCGRLEFADHTTPPDAAGDASGPDGGDAGSCDPAAPFGTPALMSDLSDPTVNDGTLRLMSDELTGYFWSYRGRTDADLYYVTRPDRGADFTVTPVQGLSTTMQELDPAFPADGSELVFRRSGPGNDLYVATPNGPGSFDPPSAIGAINMASNEVQAFIPLGRDEVYFSADRTGGGDLYMSTFSGTTFSAPLLVTGLATAADEGDPVVTADGLTIYFRSNRAAALLGYNIFTATRSSVTSAFGPAQLVPNINTDSDDGASWISPDGCRLYISSDVAGTNDIYVSTRGVQ